MTFVRHVFLAAACLAALGLWPAAPAWSHAYLVRSTPAARAVVARAPERVQLYFNERLEPAYSRVSVWDREARRVDADDAQVAIGPRQPGSEIPEGWKTVTADAGISIAIPPEWDAYDFGETSVAPAEPSRLSVGVPPLPAGPYTVKYRVLSVDGHVVEAEFTFTVRGAS